MPAEDQLLDPYGAHYFALELNGIEIAHFMEFSGIKTSSTVFEIEEGGVNGYTHKRPGQSKWENLVLKYASSASTQLLEFRDAFNLDQFESRPTNSGAVIMYDNQGNEVRRYSFKRAWPVSWEGPSLNAGSSELAIETLELAHEGIEVTGPMGPVDNTPPPAPAPEQPGAVLEDGKIVILDPIQFEYDSHEVKGESQKTLDEVAQILRDNPDMEVEVAGHASSEGTDAYNQDLSQRRTDEVVRQLEDRGVEGDRMTPVGYGESQPVADNSTSAGRSANRRVEFNNI